MKTKIIRMLVPALLVSNLVFGYKAAASFIVKDGSQIQLVIDGKTLNTIPKERVSIVGRPGLHEIWIRFFDNKGNYAGERCEEVNLQPGYKSYFRIFQDDHENSNKLIKEKMEPYSSKKYKSPDYYYRNRQYAIIESNNRFRKYSRIRNWA